MYVRYVMHMSLKQMCEVSSEKPLLELSQL